MSDSPHCPPLVSVIIPNWNGLELLRPCLDSLLVQTYPRQEILVVDNGSSDRSVAAVLVEYPTVRVLALDSNGGYSGGCNAGMSEASGEILVMLNNDIECEPDWLENLIAGLERHPECGSAASRMMLWDQRDKVHSAGDTYGRNGIPESRGVWQPYGPPYDKEELIFGGCGGAVAYRREMIDAIGMFEERFFMYCEDVDLNWRAQLAGFCCVYVPDAVVYHHLSATGGGALASYYVGRNTLWVMARNMPGELLRRHWRAILGAQWRITWDALRAWRGKAARARLRGQLSGLFTWPMWRAYRHANRSSHDSVAYIASLLT